MQFPFFQVFKLFGYRYDCKRSFDHFYRGFPYVKKIGEIKKSKKYFSCKTLFNDPIYTLNAFRDKNDSINFPKWENKKYKEIMNLAEREVDQQKRKLQYLEAEKILLDEMPVMPIYLVEALALKKKNFCIQYSSPFMDFKWGYFI